MDSQHGVSSGSSSWISKLFGQKDQSLQKAKATELNTKMNTLAAKMESYTSRLNPDSDQSDPEAHEMINTIVDINHTTNEIKSEIDQVNKKMKSLWVRFQPKRRNELKEIRNILTNAMELGQIQDIRTGKTVLSHLIDSAKVAIARALAKGELFNKLEHTDTGKMMMKLNFCRNLLQNQDKFDKALLEYVAKQDRPEEFIKHFPSNIKFPREYATIGSKFNNYIHQINGKKEKIEFNRVLVGFGENSAKVKIRQLTEQIEGSGLELKKINKLMTDKVSAKGVEQHSVTSEDQKTARDEEKVHINMMNINFSQAPSEEAVFDKLLEQNNNEPSTNLEELSDAMDKVIDEENEYLTTIKNSLNTKDNSKLLRVITLLDNMNQLTYYMGGLDQAHRTDELVAEFRQGLVDEILNSADQNKAIDDFIEEFKIVLETKANSEKQKKTLTKQERSQIPAPEIHKKDKKVEIEALTKVAEYKREGEIDTHDIATQSTEQLYTEFTVEQKSKMPRNRAKISPALYVSKCLASYIKKCKQFGELPDYDEFKKQITSSIKSSLKELNLDQNEIHIKRFQQELDSQIAALKKE